LIESIAAERRLLSMLSEREEAAAHAA
jgi:hypothetical protein